MKYLDMVETMFPRHEYELTFKKDEYGFNVLIRINDYVMTQNISHRFGIYNYKALKDTVLFEREFQYMLEAIQGKLDHVRESRFLP